MAAVSSAAKKATDTSWQPHTLTWQQLKANAEALVPVFAARAAETENLRKLPKENMHDLYKAGLLSVVVPKRYGGLEMDWPALPEVARIVARGCPSTAWIVAVVGGHGAIVGRMPQYLQDEMFAAGPNQLFVTASAQTTGTIKKTKGGVTVNGIWRFASGCDHADWIMVNGELLNEDGSKSSRPNVRIITRAENVEIVDTWHVAGMKGTGSKDLNFNSLFVPDDHVLDSPSNFLGGPEGAAVNPGGYLYDVPFSPYFSSWLLGPILGAAEGAYEAYRSTTKGRVGSMVQYTSTVAQMPTVQERLAESYCELEAARALYDKHNKFLHERGAARLNIAVDEFIDSGRERSYIARLCYNLVQRLVKQMGAVGIYDTNPVQRFSRDLNVMQNQLAVNWDVHMLNFGRRQFGLPTGMERLDNPPPERPCWGLANGKAKAP
ncbi:MAG: acyl-CoA dehydrogenase family protein [Rhodospirillaceae bacterium]|nr:acyl-CoA dehydrogenase family protein [Rhodospirillaceae bacterium]